MVTTDTMQKPQKTQISLPSWLIPGTYEWDKLVKRVGLQEANERRQAALNEQRIATERIAQRELVTQ
jgi:hypothetical protein